MVAKQFFSLSGNSQVKFRLLTTDDDDCRRFHVDFRQLRLLCTYQGPGTEWLTNDQVDRDALDRGEPNESIIKFGTPLHLKPFWVGLMKDERHIDNHLQNSLRNTGNGLVHCSPPMGDQYQIRVVFCLDAT